MQGWNWIRNLLAFRGSVLFHLTNSGIGGPGAGGDKTLSWELRRDFVRSFVGAYRVDQGRDEVLRRSPSFLPPSLSPPPSTLKQACLSFNPEVDLMNFNPVPLERKDKRWNRLCSFFRVEANWIFTQQYDIRRRKRTNENRKGLRKPPCRRCFLCLSLSPLITLRGGA